MKLSNIIKLSPRTRILNSNTVDHLGQIILCEGRLFCHLKMLCSIPGLYPLGCPQHLPPQPPATFMITTNVTSYCQMFPGRAKSPQFRTTVLGDCITYQHHQLGETLFCTDSVWYQTAEFLTVWWGTKWNLGIISIWICLIMRGWASCLFFFFLVFSLNCLFIFFKLYIWQSIFTLYLFIFSYTFLENFYILQRLLLSNMSWDFFNIVICFLIFVMVLWDADILNFFM